MTKRENERRKREERNALVVAEARKHERPMTALARSQVEQKFLEILRRKYPDRAWSIDRGEEAGDD
jgi:hypothetical protein